MFWCVLVVSPGPFFLLSSCLGLPFFLWPRNKCPKKTTRRNPWAQAANPAEDLSGGSFCAGVRGGFGFRSPRLGFFGGYLCLCFLRPRVRRCRLPRTVRRPWPGTMRFRHCSMVRGVRDQQCDMYFHPIPLVLHLSLTGNRLCGGGRYGPRKP